MKPDLVLPAHCHPFASRVINDDFIMAAVQIHDVYIIFNHIRIFPMHIGDLTALL